VIVVSSVLLILVAGVLLVLGLLDGSSTFLIASVALSLLAAMIRVVGARRAATIRVEGGRYGPGVTEERVVEEVVEAPEFAFAGGRTGHAADRAAAAREAAAREAAEPADGAAESVVFTEPVTVSEQPGVDAEPGDPADEIVVESRAERAEPTAAADAASPAGDAEPEYDDDPPDEPAPQAVSAADAAKVARMSTEVLVIDGRPRYHLPGCLVLLGRESQPLPVSEAVALDFTPCSLCEPANALLT
jgi:hypothetical protein